MSFFSKLRSFLSNSIECPSKFEDNLIYMPSIKKGRIKIGQTLFVGENSMAVLVVKGKATDIYATGKHKLTVGLMPIASKKITLTKGKKQNQKMIDSFKGEIYFVNLNKFESGFIGVEPFIIKDEKLGKAKVRVNGKFIYTVENAKLLISTVLMQWARIKNDAVKKKLSLWVSEMVIIQLKKLNLPLFEFAKNNSYISERIFPSIHKKFLGYGLNVETVCLTETFVPNKFNQALIQMQENLEEGSGANLFNNKNYMNEIEENNHTNEEIYEDRQFTPEEQRVFNPLASNVEFVAPGEEVVPVEYCPNGNTQVLVDTNDFGDNVKLCPNCSAMLDKNANACYNCGYTYSMKRTCSNCGVEVEEGEFVCPNCRSIMID